MLVLSRKLKEAIRIGNDIRITVTRIGRNSVRLGIEAPDAISVVREEIDVPYGPEEDGAELGQLVQAAEFATS